MRKRTILFFVFLILVILGLEFFIGIIYLIPIFFSITFYKILFSKIFKKREENIKKDEKIFGEEDEYLGIEVGLPIEYLNDMYLPYEPIVVTTEGEIIIEND